MKSYHAFAWKELFAQKIMSSLILIAIILSTMMTTAAGQSAGVLNAMRKQQAAYINGNRYATFHELTSEQANRIAKDSRISYAGKTIFLGTSDIENSSLSIQLREYEEDALSAYTSISILQSGCLPEKSGEIALPENALSLLGFSGDLGDTISLKVYVSLMQDKDVPYEYSHDFTLTGILEPNYMGYVSGTITGVVGEGSANAVLPEKYQLYALDIRTSDTVKFQETVDSLSNIATNSGIYVQYNDTLLSALGIDYRIKSGADIGSGFSFMTLVIIIITMLILFAAGLVIFNVLKIGVSKRIREYGVLRAIGAQRGQLYLLVSIQIILLSIIAIPIGVMLGTITSNGITTMVTNFFSPEMYMAASKSEVLALVESNNSSRIIPLIISAAISLISAFISALPAARWASKISPTVSMSNAGINIKRKNRKKKKFHSFEVFFARLNLSRNKGRTAVTIISLAMSITVFVALQSFSSLLNLTTSVQQMHKGDYAITSETIGFTSDDLNGLKNLPGIVSTSTVKFSMYGQNESGYVSEIQTSFPLQPGESLQIIGLDEEQLKAMSGTHDIQPFIDGSICMILNPYSKSANGMDVTPTKFEKGEKISVGNMSFTVYSLLQESIRLNNSPYYNGVQVIVSDNIYDELTGRSNYTEIYPVLSDGADITMIENKIISLCDRSSGQWFSYLETDKQLEESYEQIRLVSWGFILFIAFIGILNIINTVYTNIHTRTKEIGVQLAIGMSAKSLYKTFMWEGALYGIIAAIIGGGVGYILSIFISVDSSDLFLITAIPIISIILAAIVSITACLFATYLPLKQASKKSIVDMIHSSD